MDFFQHRYYKTNKILLQLLGLWPYQNIRVRVVIVAGVLLLIFSLLIPELIIVVKNIDDRDFIVECAISLIVFGICLTKVLIYTINSSKSIRNVDVSFHYLISCYLPKFIWNEKLFFTLLQYTTFWITVLKLLNRIRTDWQILGHDRDIDILHEYAEKGRKFTTIYTVTLITNGIIFVIQPVIPKIIDILWKNNTKPGQFPIPLDYYYIDMQKNYFYLITHCGVCISLGFLIGIAFDCMFIVYIQHGCGLFAILRCKLERIGKKQMSAESDGIAYEMEKPIIAFKYLVWCIDKHNRAIEYAQLIDATYSWSFFCVAAFNMILISVEGVQIIEKTNQPEVTIKLLICIGTSMLHLYIESYMGQILMDHSSSIHNYILNGKWYMLPLKAQKLLPLMMMRSNIPCKLTLAKLAVMSVETFGVILKTSLSYFTMLHSM